jgi:hypothetical protein
MPRRIEFDAEVIRAAVQRTVDRTSLRHAADEIGISKSGLDTFLKGRTPYSRTRALLVAWSLRQRAPEQPVTPSEVDAAIAVLELYIQGVGSDAARRRRVREVTKRLFEAPGES